MFSHLLYIIKHLFTKQPLQFKNNNNKKKTSLKNESNLCIKSTKGV